VTTNRCGSFAFAQHNRCCFPCPQAVQAVQLQNLRSFVLSTLCTGKCWTRHLYYMMGLQRFPFQSQAKLLGLEESPGVNSTLESGIVCRFRSDGQTLEGFTAAHRPPLIGSLPAITRLLPLGFLSASTFFSQRGGMGELAVQPLAAEHRHLRCR